MIEWQTASRTGIRYFSLNFHCSHPKEIWDGSHLQKAYPKYHLSSRWGGWSGRQSLGIWHGREYMFKLVCLRVLLRINKSFFFFNPNFVADTPPPAYLPLKTHDQDGSQPMDTNMIDAFSALRNQQEGKMNCCLFSLESEVLCVQMLLAPTNFLLVLNSYLKRSIYNKRISPENSLV